MGSTSSKTPLIFIVGETASGKTAAGIKIAQRVGGEIICADSRTVYKQMNIGTAKPTLSEQKLVTHHLIDIIEPNETFSAAEFNRRAEECIQDIRRRGKVPIIVGGTGLYIDALLYNFQFKDKPDDTYRTQLLQMNDEELTTLLHTKNIDTSKLNTKNRRHVIRAIERDGEVPKNTKMREDALIYGLTLSRDVLRKRIEDRISDMISDGFVEETRIIGEKYGWRNEAMSGVGYRAVYDYIEGLISDDNLRKVLIQRDLSLAKRQRTWFKRNKNIHWFDNPEDLVREAISCISC